MHTLNGLNSLGAWAIYMFVILLASRLYSYFMTTRMKKH